MKKTLLRLFGLICFCVLYLVYHSFTIVIFILLLLLSLILTGYEQFVYGYRLFKRRV